jgi:hypothetical protein
MTNVQTTSRDGDGCQMAAPAEYAAPCAAIDKTTETRNVGTRRGNFPTLPRLSAPPHCLTAPMPAELVATPALPVSNEHAIAASALPAYAMLAR